jgi:hypothetical protein
VWPAKKLWPGQATPPPPPHPSAVPLAPSVSWFPHCHYICSCLRRVHHPLACAMRSGCKARCPRVEINWGHLALRNCPVNLTIQNTGASSPPPPPPLFFSWHAPSSLHALLLLLACISKHYPLPQCASSLCCAVQCRQPKPELRERLAELGSVVASAKHKEWRTMAEIQVGGHTHWHPPPLPPPPPPRPPLKFSTPAPCTSRMASTPHCGMVRTEERVCVFVPRGCGC